MTELERTEGEVRTLEGLRTTLQFLWTDLGRVRYPTKILKEHLTDALTECDNLLNSYEQRLTNLKDQQ